MVFFCFSSKDRHQIVEAILFHITNYEIPVWYDRYKMLLGDQRNDKNFDEGINQSKYAIIILSPNAISSICAQEEISIIYEQYKKKLITVFPIFYNIKAIDIPESMEWMKDLVYKEITPEIDVLGTCNHIICRILLDEIAKYRIQSINNFLLEYGNNSGLSYIVNILQAYQRVDDCNKNAQISLLFAICVYLQSYYGFKSTPKYYYAGVENIFNQTRLNLPIDLREILILERLTILLINVVLFGYII